MRVSKDRTPLVLFLDMNVWVEMARGVMKTEPGWLSTVRDLRQLVDSERVVVPLSPAHYLELWHRGTQTSREDVGRLIRDVSKYAAFASIWKVRELEVEALVSRFVERNRTVRPADVLGTGASHAFGSRFGRFRFVESIASPDGSALEGKPVAAPSNLVDADLHGPGWEWFQLVGTAEVVENAGSERAPEHRLGNESLSEELRLRELLRRQKWARNRLRDILISDELTGLTDEINRMCWQERLQPHALFLENPDFHTPSEAMRAFVRELPIVDVLVTLREWKHRDLNHLWDQHDRTDIHALSVAVPYSDIVVTERRWAHLIRASGLARTYETQVRGSSDFRSVVAALLSGEEH